MKKPCHFCGSVENIKALDLTHKETKEKAPICHTCFNQAARCTDGLLVMGEPIHLSIPQPRCDVTFLRGRK